MNSNTVRLKDIIAPSFYEVHIAIKKGTYTHFWLKGGRGSAKSSFVSIEIPKGIMLDPMANAVVFRKVFDTMRGSVAEQLRWGIDMLGVNHLWHYTVSPLKLTYMPTGQQIVFRGADKPERIKSAKLNRGYFKYLWYEEVDEFNGMPEIRKINQTFLRGGDEFIVFYTYNPPQSAANWVNAESAIARGDKFIHHSHYKDVPKEWLGQQFLLEAEHLKVINKKAYDHEYGGEATGTGGEVFKNVKARYITDEEISRFDQIRRGIDWGYAVDPFHYTEAHYDKTRRKLYIFREINGIGISNRSAAERIKAINTNNGVIICDSAEPKSIAEMNSYNLRVVGAKKGPDSVDYGMKFLVDMEEIIIDPRRCPVTYREFSGYELAPDNHGGFKSGYPDIDNHSIDAVRYALEDDMLQSRIVGQKPIGF